MRVSMHNGRDGLARHNDRDFDLKAEHAQHIDASKSSDNLIWQMKKYQGMSFRDAELAFYRDNFGAALQEKNQRYLRQRHPERCRTIEQLYTDGKTKPEETLLTIGNRNDAVSLDVFTACINDYNARLRTWNKAHGQPFRNLNGAIHVDEQGAIHGHQRRVWVYRDKDGNLCLGQNKALEAAGVEPPDPSKPISRYNTRKMTFDRWARQQWQEVCQAHGLQIETEPRADGRRHLRTADYIRMDDARAQEALQRSQEALARAEQERETAQQELRQAQEATQTAQQERAISRYNTRQELRQAQEATQTAQQERARAEQEREIAQQELRQAQEATQTAQQERARAEQERETAQQDAQKAREDTDRLRQLEDEAIKANDEQLARNKRLLAAEEQLTNRIETAEQELQQIAGQRQALDQLYARLDKADKARTRAHMADHPLLDQWDREYVKVQRNWRGKATGVIISDMDVWRKMDKHMWSVSEAGTIIGQARGAVKVAEQTVAKLATTPVKMAKQIDGLAKQLAKTNQELEAERWARQAAEADAAREAGKVRGAVDRERNQSDKRMQRADRLAPGLQQAEANVARTAKHMGISLDDVIDHITREADALGIDILRYASTDDPARDWRFLNDFDKEAERLKKLQRSI